jgi:hypothetical protein
MTCYDRQTNDLYSFVLILLILLPQGSKKEQQKKDNAENAMNQILSSRTPVERSKRIKNDSEEECF